MAHHSTIQCPSRSMAWITTNQQKTVIHATAESITILGFDPVGQSLDAIWQPLQQRDNTNLVSTITHKILEICKHVEAETTTILCTDMTELNHMYLASRQKYSQVAISRLTMYGTIDAVFQSDEQNTTLVVGQPIMRYIHSDDLQLFCAGLKQVTTATSATEYNSIAAFSVRFTNDDHVEFTVMSIEGGKLLCLMKPSEKRPSPIELTSCNSSSNSNSNSNNHNNHNYNVLRTSVTQIQHKFWYAVEHGMTFIAHNLANSLIMMIQTLWCLWHDSNKPCTWSGLFATSSEYLVKKVVSTTKERPEIDTLCHLISYVGISKSTSRSWFDCTLDTTSAWLIQKALVDQHDDDGLI